MFIIIIIIPVQAVKKHTEQLMDFFQHIYGSGSKAQVSNLLQSF